MNDLKGMNIAITGASGGLGEQTCLHLAKMGANFILLNRNLEKSKVLEEKIKNKWPQCEVKHIQVDLEDVQSVKEASKELNKYCPDVLILNAGAYKLQRKKQGEVDNIFLINFLSQYVLAKNCYEENPNMKVVAVGSIAHKGVRLNEKDIALLNCKKQVKVYGNSKRFLMFALMELFKDNLSIVHPGITFTNITAQYPKILLPFIKFFMKLIFPSTKKASLNIVSGVFEKCKYGYWIGPKYFDIWGKPKLKKLKTFSQQESQKIFEIAERLYKTI